MVSLIKITAFGQNFKMTDLSQLGEYRIRTQDSNAYDILNVKDRIRLKV